MKTNEQRLSDLLARLDSLSYIKPSRIPDIDLYMDQVTTFMDENLKKAKRNPEDKALTKTMINNYAKNNLLPPPVKKNIPGIIFFFCYLSITTKTSYPFMISENC